MKVILVILIKLILIVVLSKLRSRYKISPYLIRKVLHTSIALIVVFLINYLSKTEFLVLMSVFSIFYTYLYYYSPLKFLEVNGKKNIGSVLYPIALLLMGSFLFSSYKDLATGVLILGIPDTMAGLTNYYLKSTRKTIASSAVYLIISIIILQFSYPILFTIFIALVLTLVERYSKYGSDNITVPIVYTGLTILTQNSILISSVLI